ncbi:MAG: 6-bladed beta-propeller [bacterium]|nr:6-bladed beta-propeller [bacterium]
MKNFIPILFLAAFLITYCAEEELNYTLEVADGVHNIHNLYPKYSNKPEIELQYVRKIGELESENVQMQFYEPRDILMDADDNIFIVDAGNHRIVKLDTNGNFILDFGERGQGPGEFRYLFSASIDSKGYLHVGELDRIQIFNSDGKYISSYKLKYTFSFEFTSDDNYAVTGIVVRSEDRKDFLKNIDQQPVLQVFDRNGEVVTKIGKRKNYSNRTMRSSGNSTSLAMDSEGNYYLAYSARNLIEKYSSGGNLIFRSSKETDMIESEEAEQVSTTNKLGEGAIMPMFTRFAKNSAIDGKGRLWMEVYNRRMTIEERKKFRDNTAKDLISLEVYNSDGVFLQRIPWEFGNSRPLNYIRGDRVFFIDNNDMCIYEYRIVETKDNGN